MPGRITVCGLGPGSRGDITAGTLDAIEQATSRFVRTKRHPTAGLVPDAVSFDDHYDHADRLDDVYRSIAQTLIEAATQSGPVLYAVPGSPLVLERSVQHLLASGNESSGLEQDVEVEVMPAVSFLDAAWVRLGIDPIESSVRLIDGHTFARDAAGERGPLLVAHTHASWVLSDIKLAVDAGPEQSAVVLQRLGTDEERITEVAWPDLDRVVDPDHLTSLYLPEVTAPVGQELLRSVELMHRLRSDCPWDREQTHRSLRRYLLEEAYEVIDAIDGLDGAAGYEELEEELGDLWFQVLFHAELATEAGAFTIADVARTVHDKLVARHPHVFGTVDVDGPADVVANWEQIKRDEKGRRSVMDGIPSSLPALTMAEKILSKGARAGSAVDPALTARIVADGLDPQPDEDDVGRLLLAAVEQARVNGIDAEHALRSAAGAARSRFAATESGAVDPEARWVFG